MEQISPDQILPQIERSQRILIALPEGFLSEDVVAAAVGLKLVLEKMDKLAIIATTGSVPANLSFLPGGQPVFPSGLPNKRPLEVILSTANAKLGELSYQVEGVAVHIVLTPKSGEFETSDISVRQVPFGYDLIITLAVQNLEQLGHLYQDNAEWFYETPKLNIDTSPTNEYFGTMNLVSVTASSMSEILADVITVHAPQHINPEIATAFLTGIIAATNSFQHITTTPHALLKAADLIDLGARQQDIIVHLYKTRDFAFLKLWGRALARIKASDDKHLLYATLPAADFSKTETTGKELPLVIKELLDHVSDYQIVAIIAEIIEGDMHVALAGLPHVDLDAIAEKLSLSQKTTPFMHHNYRVTLGVIRATDLAGAEEKLNQATQTN